MAKYKSTEQVMKIISDKNKIRNFGVMFLIGFVQSSMTGTTFYDPAGMYP